MKEQDLRITGIIILSLVSIGGTYLILEELNSGFIIGLTVMWVIFSGFINLICHALPSFKIKAKTKSPIYKIEEDEDLNNVYNIRKFELVYEHVDSLTCLGTLPFIWLFKFPEYDKVFSGIVEEHDINSIEDLGEYVEREIARVKAGRKKELEAEAKKQEPLDRLNKEFKENYELLQKRR